MGTPVATLQLTFDDEFDTFSGSSNGSVGWETRLPYYGQAARTLSASGEDEYYGDSSTGVNPFSDTNGILSITASLASVTGKNYLRLPYNSGAITTYTDFSQQYGYFEINAKLPAGNGLWSAFWLAPQSLDGQSELDAFEVLGNNPSQYYATTHSEVNGTLIPNLQLLNVPDTSAAFHTYGVDWEPTTITWYEDGVAIATAPTPSNMDEKMFMLLNLAVGGPGSWPGAPTSSSEFPASYQIDYVRAYATAATEYVGGSAAIGLGAPEGLASVTGTIAVGLGVGTRIGGVTLSLLSAGGTVLQNTTSDGYGQYQFIDLNPGTYKIEEVTPVGYVPLPGTTGIITVTLTAGEAATTAVIKLLSTVGSVAGSVLMADGSAASGVAVNLLNSSGVVATTSTGAMGAFSFAGVLPGSYQVQYVAPSGETQSSGPANSATGLTDLITVAFEQAVTLAAETLAPLDASVTGSVLFAGAGEAGVAVALLDSSGAAVASTTSDSNGAFSFTGIVPGSYSLAYTAPASDSFQSGDPADTSTGDTGAITLIAGESYTAAPEDLVLTPIHLTMNGSRTVLIEGDGPFIVTGNPGGGTLQLGNGDQNVQLGGFTNTVTLGNGNETVVMNGSLQTLQVGDGSQTLTLSGNFDHVTLGNTPADGSSIVTVAGIGETVTGGNGNVTVSGPVGSTTVTLGDGDDSVTLSGSHNNVTVGTGNSVIDAGTNNETVHAAGGDITVTVAGQSNLIDIGLGDGVINAGVSRLDTFVLHGIDQGLTVINGFRINTGDVLDLAHALAGTGVASDLSNIGNYLTASVSGGNTTLLVDPTGGSAAPGAFVILDNITTSVGQLVAGGMIKLT